MQGRGTGEHPTPGGCDEENVLVGIDISAEDLVVAVERDGESLPVTSFENDGAGHRKLIRWLTKSLVAIRHEPNVRAFYEKLLARGKKPLQAIVAVMRKLLHAIYGMLRHDRDFEGEKFFAIGA